MTKELEQAAQNFPEGKLPHLIEEFYKFCLQNADGSFIDYETITDTKSYLTSLITEDAAKEFICFYVGGDHSCYAIWHNDLNIAVEDCPVVIFGSEGLVSAAASNFKEFVILFTKGLLFDIVFQWNRYYENPNSPRVTIPYDLYKEDDYAWEHEQKTSGSTVYTKMNDWLANDLKITADKDLVTMVEDAIKGNPNLREYLAAKNGIK